VRKLISTLCSTFNLTPPAELAQLAAESAKRDVLSSEPNESTSANDTSSTADTGDNLDPNLPRDAQSALDKARSNQWKLAFSGEKKGSSTANMRLMKEFKSVSMSDPCKQGDWMVEFVNENLYEWSIKVKKVDPDSDLAKDLVTLKEKTGEDYIHLNIRFKDNYPFEPPIVAIVTPRITNGHVFEGGAICLELLTKHGWNAAYTVEEIVRQVMVTICIGQGRIRFDKMTPYDIRRAENSYATLDEYHKKHGWYTPARESG